MELHTVQVERAVSHGHDGSLPIQGSYFQLNREILMIDNPGVVSPHSNLLRESGREIVISNNLHRRMHPVKHERNILQLRTKHLSNGLMPKTYTQNTLAGCVPLDEGQQQSSLFRETGAG